MNIDIETNYKISEFDGEIDEWIKRNFWDLPSEYLVEDADGIVYQFRRTTFSEMVSLGFPDIYCETVKYVLFAVEDNRDPIQGLDNWRLYDKNGELVYDLEVEVILSDLRLPDTISNQNKAKEYLHNGTIILTEGSDILDNEEEYFNAVIGEDNEENESDKVKFHEMISGGKLMSDWGRTNVHGLTFLIRYIMI